MSDPRTGSQTGRLCTPQLLFPLRKSLGAEEGPWGAVLSRPRPIPESIGGGGGGSCGRRSIRLLVALPRQLPSLSALVVSHTPEPYARTLCKQPVNPKFSEDKKRAPGFRTCIACIALGSDRLWISRDTRSQVALPCPENTGVGRVDDTRRALEFRELVMGVTRLGTGGRRAFRSGSGLLKQAGETQEQQAASEPCPPVMQSSRPGTLELSSLLTTQVDL